MAEPMRALTVKPPWSHAIAQGTKRVENRTWPAPGWAIGRDIAIHAGKGFDWGAEFPPGLSHQWAAPEDCALGAVVAVARLAGCHLNDPGGDSCGHDGDWEKDPHGGYCSPWGMPDQWHWRLADVRPLAKPVPCRGALGLWRLPGDVESAVRAQIQCDVSATPGGECAS